MYSIEINLLNDRQDVSQSRTEFGRFDTADRTPLYLGAAFGGAMLALVLLSTVVISAFNQRLIAREQDLDNQLAQLAPQIAEIERLTAETDQVQQETQALASIFNQIKPWAAMLADLQARVPPTLQITRIEQAAPPAPAAPVEGEEPPAEDVPPPSATDLRLNGRALSFGDVNDFVLTLQTSPFLNAERTNLITSERQADQRTGASLVDHEIETQINDVPTSELLQVLSARGAAGLVNRIEVLRQRGVMQP
ncbi:pilus assembly protein PilN [Synechococcales cyanobacterium C]|uniref:Pilus assembly protein PilN n=1 Tax=Petrachloros mirabilis ULC683 TaxID=2781853 RepID=A0A8K1ZXE7_9CYAN|nr:PilN domain-containing protein [Petrachloros mirabilis]NCJ05832.1 pilus assembly protein PilN [Petrachloros mirabilis ULC683]